MSQVYVYIERLSSIQTRIGLGLSLLVSILTGVECWPPLVPMLRQCQNQLKEFSFALCNINGSQNK